MKIAFITKYCSYYTQRTFELLSEKKDIKFYFHSKGRPRLWQDEQSLYRGSINHEYLGGFKILDRRITPSLLPKLWRVKYDIFIQSIDNPFAILTSYLISRIKRRPFIIWTELWIRLQSRYHRLTFPVLRYIYRHSDAIVASGEHVKRYLLSEGIDGNKIFTAPYAVDNSLYNYTVDQKELDELRQELTIASDQKVVFSLGRLEIFKGLEYLIEAFALLNREDSVLVIAGNGSRLEHLKRLANKNGISERVRFPGYVARDQTVTYYAVASVFVFPSITTPTHKETWGLVVNEAFNQGVPVIASEAVGAAVAGMVQDGHTGLMIPEKDSQTLAQAIEKILDDPELRDRMSNNARELIAGWTQEKMALGFQQAIDYVTAQSNFQNGSFNDSK